MKLKLLEIIILILLIPALCWGETISWMGYDCDKDWSWKDFTKRKFLDNNAPREGTIICGSCFSQELDDKSNRGWVRVFPESVNRLTFIGCNLDNVKVTKPNWETINCTQRNFKVKRDDKGEDLGDWEIDEQGSFIKSINE